MKKLFTLFTKTLLVAVCLLGGASSAWADDAVTDLKNIHSNLTIYFDEYVTASVAKNTLFADGYLFSPDGNTYSNGKGKDADNHLYCCRVKSATQDKIAFEVDGTCTLVLYGERVTDRTPHLNTDTEDTGSSKITGSATAGASGQKWGTVTFTIPSAGTYYIIGNGSDHYLSALKFTFVPTKAPEVVTNLNATADAIVGMASEFYFEARRTESYQWYKNSANEAVVDNDHKIDGATSSTYEYTATVAGDEYLYCVATNSIGSTTSNVCKVTATATTLYTITYDLNGGTSATGAPTQGNLAEGATFDVAEAPADLVAPTGKEFKCWNDGTTDYAPGATYTMGTNNVTLTAVYQDRTYKGLTPASTMDFDNPGTMFNSVWTTANNLIQNFYFDAPNGIAVFSAYALYQAKNNNKISWMVSDATSSTDDTWSATGNFKGNSYYFSGSPKAATVRATERMHYYRVKGITAASALMGGKAKMEAYLVTAGVVSPDPVEEEAITAAGTLSITGLSATNEYIIKVYGDNGSSNVQFREIAFTFTPSAVVEISQYEWATLVSDKDLDFTNSDVKAYIVTGRTGSAITTTQVNKVAKDTPILLNAAKGSYAIPTSFAGSADATTGNLLKAGTGAAITPLGGYTRYVLGVENEKATFLKIFTNPATVPTNKAYLEFNEEINAPMLSMDGETTGISAVNGEGVTVNGPVYDLQGRRVAQPTKGLYIVNGRKVIIK